MRISQPRQRTSWSTRAENEWTESVAAWLSALFCCGCLATIPYARNVTGSLIVTIAVVGGVSLLWARFACPAPWSRLTIWPVVVVLGAYLIAIRMSDFPAASLRRSASMALFALLFPAVQLCCLRTRAVAAVLWGVVGVVSLLSLDVAWQRFTGSSFVHGTRGGDGGVYPGSLGNRNDLAVVPLLTPLAYGVLCRYWRGWAYPAFALAVAPSWWLSRSRQVLLGWLIAVVGPLVRRKALLRRILLLMGFGLAVVPVILFVPELRARVVETLQRGIGERGPIAAFGVELFLKHPFTGISPGMFGEHYMPAASAGWSWHGEPLLAVGMPWAHNLPIEIACEFGLMGIGAFGAVLFAGIRRALQGLDRLGTWNAVARGALCSLFAGLVVGLVDLSFIKDWVRCWWWLALGLAYVRPHVHEPPGTWHRGDVSRDSA